MKASTATRLMKAVGFTAFQIEKIVGNRDEVGDDMVVQLIEIQVDNINNSQQNALQQIKTFVDRVVKEQS